MAISLGARSYSRLQLDTEVCIMTGNLYIDVPLIVNFWIWAVYVAPYFR